MRQRTHVPAAPGGDSELSEAERDMLAVATAVGVTR
jgi:hypothetical protein